MATIKSWTDGEGKKSCSQKDSSRESHATHRNSRQHWAFKGCQTFSQNTSSATIIGTADENHTSQTHRTDAMGPSSRFFVSQRICRRGSSSFSKILPTCGPTTLFQLSQRVAMNGNTQCHKSHLLTPGAEQTAGTDKLLWNKDLTKQTAPSLAIEKKE